MKILIVGLGSMGKRRARLTKGIDSSIRIAGVDTAESRRGEIESARRMLLEWLEEVEFDLLISHSEREECKK